MPIYEYECNKCGHRFEVRQGFTDSPIATCQAKGCRGKVHRVVSAPAIIFKGSGFHVNDYGRNGGKKRTQRPETECEASKTCDKQCPAAKTGSD